jgi:hypothetical protein
MGFKILKTPLPWLRVEFEVGLILRNGPGIDRGRELIL